MPTLQITKGFTLMELIGVMAIMALLAATVAPSLVKTVDRAYGDAESVNIKQLADALQQAIIETKRIPTQTTSDWVNTLSAYISLSKNQIEFNGRNFRRRIYIDPMFFTSTNTNFPGYVQSTGLTTAPVSPRIMIISDLARHAPAAPNTNAAFTQIWDQTSGATVIEGDKVKIQRLHLAPLFHRLLLTNSKPQQPSYRLENGSNSPVPPASGGADGNLTRYVMHNTRISLYVDPFPGGALASLGIVNASVAYHYKTDGINWFWERQ